MHPTAERAVAALQEGYLGAVEEELRRSVPASSDGVYRVLRYHLGWERADGTPSEGGGGKALRPLLCLMACSMVGGDWPRALPAAAAVELIHNFSLLHDDIQDQDATRRGRATAWTIWGVPQAIAAGNALRVLGDRTVAALEDRGLAAYVAREAMRMLTSRYLEMIGGQYLDMSFERSDTVTTEDYLDMIGRKTGALIQSSMAIGALVGSGEAHVADAIGRCGRGLGLAFQVWDDYLGIWGDPAKSGKPVGSDIARKKKSLPVVHVFQQTTGADRERLVRLYASPTVPGEGVEAVLQLMDAAGTRDYVQRTALAQSREALEPLESLELAAAARGQVEAMATFFVTRDR